MLNEKNEIVEIKNKDPIDERSLSLLLNSLGFDNMSEAIDELILSAETHLLEKSADYGYKNVKIGEIKVNCSFNRWYFESVISYEWLLNSWTKDVKNKKVYGHYDVNKWGSTL